MFNKVYTGGTFDLFHAGHVKFLYECWKIAGNDIFNKDVNQNIGKVIVSLNTDEFVLKFKGKSPIYSFNERKELLLGCKWVSDVVTNKGGNDSKPAILKVQPNFIVVGSDWACKDYYYQMGFTQKWLDDNNITLIYVPYHKGISTTDLKKRIVEYG